LFIDSREMTGDPVLKCSVCIVGAGAAGITLAREFVDARVSVIVLESGGLEFESPTQSLCHGQATGNVFANPDQYLMTSRLRYFGGSTNHWAGYCRPFEQLDFEVRSWIAGSGWPISLEDLRDYYHRALPILDLPSFDYDIAQDFAPSRAPLKFSRNSGIQTAMIHFSSPTRFGLVYREELAKAKNIRVLLHANAVDLGLDPMGARIDRLQARCLSGKVISIEAKIFILATGGIENARMLLLSRKVRSHGVGNQHDLVGRYFMEHLAMTAGEVIVTLPAPALGLYERKRDPLRKHSSLGVFVTTAAIQRERALQAFTARIMPVPQKAITRERRNLIQTISRFDQLDDSSRPTSHERNGAVSGWLRVVAEQSPNAASRVTLSEERDQLGLNRVRLDWRVQTSDYSSIHTSLRILGAELGRASLGRVRLGVRFAEGELAPRNNGGNHHMGTTRMHSSPRGGVVDPDCRVHGVSNLFIAGSSVFPTGGAEGTTTLTIVALALRLADKLKKELAA